MSLFDLFNKSTSVKNSGICEGMVDSHTHLLPGVDDGIQTLEEALSVLSMYEELGMSEVYCTSHIMEDFPNSTEKLRERFALLTDAYKGKIKLRLAAEYMIDNLLIRRLSDKDLLVHGINEDHLLIETSYFSSPSYFDEVIDKVRSMGLWPMLAHPERYNYIDKKDFEELKKRGVKFQLNLPALAGRYGDDVKNKACYLLGNGMYDFVGTDVHRYEADFSERKLRNIDVERLKYLK